MALYQSDEDRGRDGLVWREINWNVLNSTDPFPGNTLWLTNHWISKGIPCSRWCIQKTLWKELLSALTIEVRFKCVQYYLEATFSRRSGEHDIPHMVLSTFVHLSVHRMIMKSVGSWLIMVYTIWLYYMLHTQHHQVQAVPKLIMLFPFANGTM